jgi:hypothetical protein
MIEHGRECHARIPDAEYFSCVSIPEVQTRLCCRRTPAPGGVLAKGWGLPSEESRNRDRKRNRRGRRETGTNRALEDAREIVRTELRTLCAKASLWSRGILAVSFVRAGRGP